MKKNHLNHSLQLFRKAVWLFLFVSLVSLNFLPTSTFFAGLFELISLTPAGSQRETSKKTDQSKTFPFSNSNEKNSDSNTRDKDLDEIISSKNRRVVTKKTTIAYNRLSYAILSKIPENKPFPGYFLNSFNTCFASLYRFSIF